MPKIFTYLGIMILFYSNEHEPIHAHGKYPGNESKAEILIEEGKIKETRKMYGCKVDSPIGNPPFRSLSVALGMAVCYRETTLRLCPSGTRFAIPSIAQTTVHA